LNNKVPAEVAGDRVALLGASVPALPGSIASGAGLAMVRPESVTVSADPSGASRVSAVSFLGAISRVNVTLPDGSPISAQMGSAAARTFDVGDAVTIGVEPGGVLVIPA
jgi:putative spermidine/putrescine transport system ATP-binding protein